MRSAPLLLAGALLLRLPSGPEAEAEEFSRTALSVAGGEIDLQIERVAGAQISDADIAQSVRRAAVAVASFYGAYPVRHVKMVVLRFRGRGIHGTTFGNHLIRIRLGTETPATVLRGDWTVTHEMFHLAFPDLDGRHRWMQEGLSTYFEPIARARVGDLPAGRVWRDMLRDMPQGLPREGEGGLDQTPSWGATYWGGALFWFLADVEIRERTHNRKSADDVLRAVLAAGGDGSQDWPIERVLQVGDRATGTAVMMTLYQRLARRRFEVDLSALAARLGVGAAGFDDRASLAAIRRSITAPTSASRPLPDGPLRAPTRMR